MRYGRRVLGEEEWARQRRAYDEAKRRAFKYGSRVVGPTADAEEIPATVQAATPPTPEPATTKQPAPGASGPAHTLSVAELGEVLKGEVSMQLLDELIASEFERPEGEPRKGALRLLLQAEQARGPEPRSAVVAELQGALER